MNPLNFPIEILTKILDYLELIDLYICRRLNHAIQAVITTSIRLQYKILCAEAGVLDNPRCHLPIVDRLALLKQREKAWSSIEYESSIPIEVPYRSSDIDNVAPSAYVLGRAAASDRFTTVALHAVDFLAGIERGTPPNWREINVEADVADFAMSVEEHDLIAMVTS